MFTRGRDRRCGVAAWCEVAGRWSEVFTIPSREWLRRRLPPRCTRRERNLALARRAVIARFSCLDVAHNSVGSSTAFPWASEHERTLNYPSGPGTSPEPLAATGRSRRSGAYAFADAPRCGRYQRPGRVRRKRVNALMARPTLEWQVTPRPHRLEQGKRAGRMARLTRPTPHCQRLRLKYCRSGGG